MKKIIALVLTVMMLASTLVVGISAAREAAAHIVPGEVIETKYIECRAHGQFGISDTFSGVTDGYTFKAVLKSSTEYFGDASLSEPVTYLAGSPEINMKAGTLGYNGTSEKLNYTFADNTEYTIEYVVDGDTTVYVNGTEIGTLSGAPRAMFYGVEYRALIREFAWYQNGEKFAGVKADDYDENDAVGFFADAPVVVERTTTPDELVVDYNDNVYHVHEDAVVDGKALYFCNSVWPDGQVGDGQAYLYTQSGIIPSDKVGACVLSFDMCPLSEDAELRNYFGWLVFNQKNHTFDSLPCDFEVGTWHHIDVYCFYGSVGSVLYIDGALAGGNAIITQVPGTQWCGGAIEIALDNIAVYESGGANGVKGELIYSEDFEDGVWQKKDSDGGGRILDKVLSPEIDEDVRKDLGLKYWMWDTDNCYAYLPLAEKDGKWEMDVKLAETTDHMASYFAGGPIFKVQKQSVVEDKYIACTAHGQFGISDTFSGVTDNYTFKAVLKSSTEYFGNADLGEHVTYLAGSPAINMKAGTLGYNGTSETLSYTFADNTEYTIEYVVDGNTTVYVNDTLVGTLSGAPRAMFYGVNYRYLIKEFAWYQNGEKFAGVKADDYDENDTVGFFADAPVIVERSVVTEAGAIGVGGTTLPYAFEAGEWYHVVLDGTVASGTDIYVDGVFVGNVATKAQARWCGHPSELAIDNVRITADGVDYFEDFEDGRWQSADGNGYVKDYTFDIETEPKHDIFYYMDDHTAGGNAYIVAGGYDYTVGQDAVDVSTYFDPTWGAPAAQEYVYDFDLALVPEIDTTGATYFEIWSDIAYQRWVVGTTFTGWNDGRSDGASEYSAFDWGEATKDNFHRITYKFRDHVCTIYIDGAEVYSRAYQNPWTDRIIGNVYNGTAIIDNFHIYTFTNANIIRQPNELAEKACNVGEQMKAIDLDAADFCATNGHIQYSTTRTGFPTCTEAGVDATTCAICGETAKETTVPALGHNWPGYGTKNAENGSWVWACRRGCGATVSTVAPAPTAGECSFFLDFADAIVVRNVAGIFNADGQVVANGVGTFQAGCSQNYNLFDMPSQYRNNYTISFKFNVTELFDDDGTDSYGHVVYFWYGGESGYANMFGYDFDTNEFFAEPTSGNAYGIRVPYDLELNTDYTLYFKVDAPGDVVDEGAGRNYADLYIAEGDGAAEGVLSFSDYWKTAPYLPTDKDFCILRDFGVAAEIDDFAIGDIDLAFGEIHYFDHSVGTRGDLDGNGVLGIKDLKFIKLALAGVLTLDAVQSRLADVNEDGVFDVRDYADLKVLIAG